MVIVSCMYSFFWRVFFPTFAAASSAFAAGPIKSFKPPYDTVGSIERFGPAIDALIPANAKIEKLAEGFTWSEGPAWWPQGQALIFSDVPQNVARFRRRAAPCVRAVWCRNRREPPIPVRT